MRSTNYHACLKDGQTKPSNARLFNKYGLFERFFRLAPLLLNLPQRDWPTHRQFTVRNQQLTKNETEKNINEPGRAYRLQPDRRGAIQHARRG